MNNKKNALVGFLVVDKPAGMTSARAISKIKHVLNGEKVGHTGTLDPNVTGVLVVAVGRATSSINLLEELENSSKVYDVEMKFGILTDTEDVWGQVLKVEDIPEILESDVLSIMSGMTKHYEQRPPMFSAVKHKGKRLYDLARNGIEVERKARVTQIFGFRNIELSADTLRFKVYCGRGTYVRTICVDIAKRLGTIGTMSYLKRVKNNVFYLEDSMELNEFVDFSTVEDKILDTNRVFNEFQKINLNLEHARYILNGVKVNLDRFLAKNKLGNLDKYYRVKYKDTCIAIAMREKDGIYTQVRFYNEDDLDYLK